jgi:hypothetical protein
VEQNVNPISKRGVGFCFLYVGAQFIAPRSEGVMNGSKGVMEESKGRDESRPYVGGDGADLYFIL